MNILHITTFLQGGAGKVIKDIAFHQKHNGSNVYILTSKSHEPGYCNYEEYLDEFNEMGIFVFLIDSTFKRDLYLNLNVVSKLKEIIKKYNIDIIHAHAAIPGMIGIIARAGIDNGYVPVIQTMHGWGTNKRVEHEEVDITIMNSLDQIIAVSGSDKKLMIDKGVEPSKIITIYNGIEKENSNEKNDELIEELKLKKKQGFNIIGCIGTICRRKNQQIIINALKDINTKQKLFCVFIGEGDMLEALENEVKQYKLEEKIKFYGYRNNASKYLKYFDFFILPSLSEGFSIGILEAFREKVPVICSNISTFKEIIEDEFTGYLFENDDVKSLREIILKVLNKNYQEKDIIIKNAYNKFCERFTIDKMFLKYDETYLCQNEIFQKNIVKNIH
ncbi:MULTISPECIES: glycosyltransferase family 4 protein [unclassified Clostridium]|uniref:glycosyltransferase family 4 protein n=1 Tax=unclassified Clostridium TaxID=2614128 RepID=UPI000297A5F3|nr:MULTISPECIES: glycosyltransferase family 4 protein [unclassified Clostridium]EKQ51104.1 MAG: glycosyltransferase [Clostridium sp. Maddingley MBC34-26]